MDYLTKGLHYLPVCYIINEMGRVAVNNIVETVDNSDFVKCPICKKNTRTKTLIVTVVKNFPLYCPKCNNTSLVDIVENKLIVLCK